MGEQNFDAHNIYKFKPYQYTEISVKNSKPVPPEPEWYYYEVVVNSKNIYVYDEYQTSETPNIWKFNFATRKWTNCNIMNLPGGQVEVTVVSKNDVLIICSGFDSDYSYNELYMCHLNSTTANDFCAQLAVTTGKPPSIWYGQDVVCHGEYLYTVDGTTEYDVHRINLRTLVWETVYVCEENIEIEERCMEHKLASDGESIFMFSAVGGGLIGFREISIFNIEKKEWTTRNTVGDSDISYNDGYPTDTHRFDIYQPQHDTEFRVYIGEYLGEYLNVIIWKIDVKTFQWTRICELPCTKPCDVIASAISRDGNKHYIIGYSDTATTSDVFLIETWLGIPKLSEMCWEAVLHYLKSFDKKELIRAGVPLHYVNKIE